MSKKIRLFCDTECYPDYWMIGFERIDTGHRIQLEQYYGHALDRQKILRIMREYEVVFFNGIRYDIPMICLALKGATCAQLKQASDAIVVGQINPWDFEKRFQVTIPKTGQQYTGWRGEHWDYIDIFEPAPGVDISQKLYAARLHAKKLQDLPIDPEDEIVTEDRRTIVREYNGNDLSNGIMIWNQLDEPMQLRRAMSQEYGVDLRSKSDAQIAEAVIKARVSRLLGCDVSKPGMQHGMKFRYKAPPYIKFRTPELQALLHDFETATFVVGINGKPIAPETIEGREITIGRSTYKIGLGGLHSQEKRQYVLTDANYIVKDVDAASFYPLIILNGRLYPEHLGVHFLHVYADIVRMRLEYKALVKKLKNSTDKAEKLRAKTAMESLKIVINGLFGKFGNQYSLVYSPNLMIQTTVTGQLALLMQIEMQESIGVHVVSANTDGIVMHCPRYLEGKSEAVTQAWEKMLGFESETTYYAALYSASVNSYLAIKTDGETKGKGIHFNPWAKNDLRGQLMKSPDRMICVEAVEQYLLKGTPLHQTILECTDIRKFVLVQTVRGGAVMQGQASVQCLADEIALKRLKDKIKRELKKDPAKWEIDWRAYVARDGKVTDDLLFEAFVRLNGRWPETRTGSYYLGRVARWYIAAGETRCIAYKTSGNKVADSEGARPVMELPDYFPNDINYQWYIEKAIGMLDDFGVTYQQPQQRLAA